MEYHKGVDVADPQLAVLQEKIQGGTTELQELLDTIEQPDACVQAPDQKVHSLRGSNCQAEVCHSVKEAVKLQRTLACRRRSKPRRHPAFNLSEVNALIAEHVAAGLEDALELPNFTAPQRKQVKELAAEYGLEPRACGRAGQTLFRAARTVKPSLQQQAKVLQLLQCSLSSPGSQHAKQKRRGARDRGKAAEDSTPALQTQISDSNKGHQILQQMGWQGGGLGAQGQGILDPVPLSRQQGRKGLGQDHTVRAAANQAS